MRTIAVIPARMASSRFPGKPMEFIHGIPMIGHCFFRANMCPDVDATFVATCDQEIFDYIKSIGGVPIMTSSEHERASDRAAEAMLSVEKRYGVTVEVLAMIQGDEPMDTPTMVSDAVIAMRNNKTIGVVNLMGLIESEREFEDPNTVKVVVDSEDYALFFSREPIPSRKKGVSQVPMYKQICVIPFRRSALLEFNKLEETPLEIVESVDMLRVLESGGRVKMVRTSEPSIGVDTPDDLRKVEKIMEFDSLRLVYTSKRSVE